LNQFKDEKEQSALQFESCMYTVVNPNLSDL
jgi:hypothetical protein